MPHLNGRESLASGLLLFELILPLVKGKSTKFSFVCLKEPDFLNSTLIEVFGVTEMEPISVSIASTVCLSF